MAMCCRLSCDESWARWTNSRGVSLASANHPVLLLANVLPIRVKQRLRCGWLYNRNRPTLSANQMGNNSVFTRTQVGNSTLHKRPFAILQRAPHDLLSLGFSLELFKELHTHVLICKLKRKEQEPCFLSYCTLHKALIASNSLHGFDFITLKWVILMSPTVPKRTEQNRSDCATVQMGLWIPLRFPWPGLYLISHAQ